MSLIPAALLVIAVFFALQYPISREKHRAMLAELELNN
jgi:Na+/melibiose symporter-like transporter